MRIKLENITKIDKADVVVDGITVIAGENSSGKSTVGRVLYSIFDCGQKPTGEMIENRISDEFNGAVYNFNAKNDGKIIFSAENIEGEIDVTESKIEARIDGENNYHSIYLDDPHILDVPMDSIEHLKSFYPKHRIDLQKKLVSKNKTVDGSEIPGRIYEKVEGTLAERDGCFWYETKNKKTVDIRNTSSGVKTLLIVARLIENGWIDENTIIVLDEPEIHLHPEWQLFFAKIIVEINKTMKSKIVLNTHSPYLLNAIEVYSEKNDIYKNLKFYFSENEGNFAIIRDYTENVEKIYKKLVNPFLKLDDEAYRDE